MPLILGTNSIKDTGYDVDNSARFETNTYMTKTASSGNTKTFTISFWTKRSALGSVPSGSNQFPISFYQNGDNRISVAFLTANTFIVYAAVGGADKMNFTTNRVFRDTSAWYHVVIKVDTTQGTEANRFKMYINGVQETSFSTATYPSQNDDLTINTNIYLGTYDTSNNFFHGYLSEFVYIDGTAYDQTSFGEFDEDSGIWKPIDVSGLTFGTNGFYLDFENSGSLGADVSGNGNNFTVNNLTAIDSVSDVPTNNFATLNPLIYSSASKTYSEGNTAISTSDSGNWCATQNNIGVSSGKWYMEIKITNKAYLFAVGVGFNPLDSNGSNVTAFINSTYLVGEDTGTYGWRDNGALPQGGTSISTYTTNDILMIALDMDNLKVYFGKNGTWENSGDPTSGATGTGSMGNLTAGEDYFFIVTPRNGSASVNFGSPAFAISSGNTDGNSYGNFEYAVPSGYYALNTKNLAEYG